MARTLPVADRSEEIDELLTFFGAMVRQVDSSLLDEWERIWFLDQPSHMTPLRTHGGII